MIKVYKYVLKPKDSQLVPMPEGARILHAASQRNEICVWAEVDIDKPEANRRIDVCGTGEGPPLGEAATYVGTALLYGESIVIHVYDLGYVE